MGESSIAWTARPLVATLRGWCAHARYRVEPCDCWTAADYAALPRCLDVRCGGCWAPGYTFNPWIGCVAPPDTPECDHCYAEAGAKRSGLARWGEATPRFFTGEDYWRNLQRWDERAERKGQRRGVFIASMSDVFEVRSDDVGHRQHATRARLWEEIERRRSLDFMLLTKRPDRVLPLVPRSWLDEWPGHVWVGATCGAAGSEWRLLALEVVASRGAKTFVSAEPWLGEGPGIASFVAGRVFCPACHRLGCRGEGERTCNDCRCKRGVAVELRDVTPSWWILGGESGASSRACDLGSVELAIAAATEAGAPVFVKQLGSVWARQNKGAGLVRGTTQGEDPYRWPERLRRRELPRAFDVGAARDEVG